MSKKQIFLLIAVLILGYAAMLGGSFLYLKMQPNEELEAMQDSLAQVERQLAELRNQPLDLTWDVSGESGPPQDNTAEEMIEEKEKEQDPEKEDIDAKLQEAQAKTKQEAIAAADSIAAAKTDPMKAEVSESRKEVEEVLDRVEGLENLLAILATEADSLDQANARRLAKIVEAMRPADAAKVLGRLSSRTTARLLVSMRQRSAAKILAEMSPERAAAIARFLSQAYDEFAI